MEDLPRPDADLARRTRRGFKPRCVDGDGPTWREPRATRRRGLRGAAGHQRQRLIPTRALQQERHLESRRTHSQRAADQRLADRLRRILGTRHLGPRPPPGRNRRRRRSRPPNIPKHKHRLSHQWPSRVGLSTVGGQPERFFLAFRRPGVTLQAALSNPIHSQASGNPVRIGDGCATVTGYKLPQPLVSLETGKAGARFQARSQDIGLAVLVMAVRAGQAWTPVRPQRPTSPSKRRMRPARRASARPGFAECLHSPICRGLKAFCFLLVSPADPARTQGREDFIPPGACGPWLGKPKVAHQPTAPVASKPPGRQLKKNQSHV